MEIKENRKVGPLSVSVMNNALVTIVKVVQNESIKVEIIKLNRGGELENKCRLKQLNPFINDRGILLVGGRLRKSELCYHAKFQILLPGKHQFTTNKLRYEHIKNVHAVTQLLISLVRQKYWPGNVINEAKKVIQNCINCYKTRPIIAQQIRGDLPHG